MEWQFWQVEVVLTMSPTKENSIFLAHAFKRGYGSIEQIYRWLPKMTKLFVIKDQAIPLFNRLNGLRKRSDGELNSKRQKW
jgi:hypothetical protein